MLNRRGRSPWLSKSLRQGKFLLLGLSLFGLSVFSLPLLAACGAEVPGSPTPNDSESGQAAVRQEGRPSNISGNGAPGEMDSGGAGGQASGQASGSAAIALAESQAKDAATPVSETVLAPPSAATTGQTPAQPPASAEYRDSPAAVSESGDSLAGPAADTLLQLIEPLDEPEFYCVDVPGFGSSLATDAPLQAHTCKPGADDELFRLNQPSAGRISMPVFDLCMEAYGDQVYTRPCGNGTSQTFLHGVDGSLRTGDGQLCLSVAPGDGAPAGGRSHLRRDLLLIPCAGADRNLSRWAAPGPEPSSRNGPATRLMYDALDSALLGDPWEIEKMGALGDPAFIPVLVELMRFPWWRRDRTVEAAIFDALDRIADRNPSVKGVDSEDSVDEWSRWVVWIGQHPEVWPPPGFAGWKGALYSDLVDGETGTFLYDGMPTNIRVEEIVWGGVQKDGIPDLTDAPVIPGAEAAYLDPEDRVFGVSFNGEHRAYPHRIVNAHEMANDVVGGVPFALTY